MKVIEKGRKAILVCEASGSPDLDVYWVKDGLRLDPNPRHTIVDKGKLRGERPTKMTTENFAFKGCLTHRKVGKMT